MQTRRVLTGSIASLALIAVACGGGQADPPTTPAGQDSTTIPASTSASSSATTTGSATTAHQDSTTTTGGGPVALPSDCSGIGDAAEQRTITFATQDTIYELAPSGEIRCLTGLPDAVEAPLAWSPDGSRLAFADGTVLGLGGTTRGPISDLGGAPVWTAPTGQSLIYVNSAGSLTKARADGSSSEILAPLVQHDAVAYHPDGTTFAVAGRDDTDQYGVWITANDGSDPRLLTFTDRVVITEMSFNADASSLFFVADHGDVTHVHSAYLEPIDIGDGELVIGTNFEDGLPPVADSDLGISGLAVSPPGFLNAVGYHNDRCEGFVAVQGEDFEWTTVRLGAGTQPIGFLDPAEDGRHRLIVAEADDCTGPAELAMVTVGHTDTEIDRTTLVSGADAAAIRAPATTPIFTLAGIRIEPFA